MRLWMCKAGRYQSDPPEHHEGEAQVPGESRSSKCTRDEKRGCRKSR